MNKNKVLLISFFLLSIFFLVSPINIFWDSAHYTSFVSIFEGALPWKSWDIVRGPVFPLIIHLSNLAFGKTAVGLSITAYIFYLVGLISVYKIVVDSIRIDNKKEKIFLGILLGFYILDPIIYGYTHALLTEFVAIPFALLMCYLTWKWIDIDLLKNKKCFIILSIFFIISIPFSWHLKQPYLGITLFPILIAYIISCIKYSNKKNIISKSIVVLLCFISLIGSIKLWNAFLESKKINLNSERNVTQGFGKQLISGLNNYELIENETKTKYLSKEEKKLYKTGDYKIINVYSVSDKLVDQVLIKTDDTNISTIASSKFIITQLFQHPLLVMDSYATNYLALINFMPKKTDDEVVYYIDKRIDLNYCHENCAIGLKPSVSGSNVVYMLDDAKIRVSNYEQYNDTPYLIRGYLRISSYLFLNIFKIVFLILPIICVCSLVSLIKKKTKLTEIIVILSWYSLLHLLVHTVTGANIDRYASPAYMTTVIAIVLYIYYLSVNCGYISKKEKSKKALV